MSLVFHVKCILSGFLCLHISKQFKFKHKLLNSALLLTLIGRGGAQSNNGSVMAFQSPPKINFALGNVVMNVEMSFSNCWNNSFFLQLFLYHKYFPE